MEHVLPGALWRRTRHAFKRKQRCHAHIIWRVCHRQLRLDSSVMRAAWGRKMLPTDSVTRKESACAGFPLAVALFIPCAGQNFFWRQGGKVLHFLSRSRYHSSTGNGKECGIGGKQRDSTTGPCRGAEGSGVENFLWQGCFHKL